MGLLQDIPTAARNVTSFNFTHAVYDPTSSFEKLLAFLSITHFSLVSIYLALILLTRERIYISLLTGQSLCELLNKVLKRYFNQARPEFSYGQGSGMPSSHSMFFAFFAAWSVMHLLVRQKSIPNVVSRYVQSSLVLLWSAGVIYSRHVPFLLPHATCHL